MFPAVAVIISTLVERFAWTTYTLVGLLFILAGNLVVLMRSKEQLTGDNCKKQTNSAEKTDINQTKLKTRS
jgi:hypothetical protein